MRKLSAGVGKQLVQPLLQKAKKIHLSVFSSELFPGDPSADFFLRLPPKPIPSQMEQIISFAAIPSSQLLMITSY